MIRKLLDKLLYIEDDPKSKLNRRWKRTLQAGFWNGSIYLGIALILIQFENRKTSRIAVSKTLHLVYDPRKWKIKQEHIYYDGPHCFYNFGPICYANEWTWCDKCYNEK